MLQVFLAHTYLELQQNEQAVEIYIGLSGAGLVNSTYIMAQVSIDPVPFLLHLNNYDVSAQVAIAFHNMRQVDQAVTYFKQLGTVDPYRLDNLDNHLSIFHPPPSIPTGWTTSTPIATCFMLKSREWSWPTLLTGDLSFHVCPGGDQDF